MSRAPTEKTRAFLPFAALALDWSVRRSNILMGPRRVGKTVMLRQVINRAISQCFDGQNILFVSIDTPLFSGMPLSHPVDLFEEVANQDPYGRRIIVFDEIQYLKDWEMHLKVLTDQCPITRFVASGSSAAALRLNGQESGAGRFTES